MTVDDIMALAAHCYSRFGNDVTQLQLMQAIEQALADAVAAERERCAAWFEEPEQDRWLTPEECAAAIRKGTRHHDRSVKGK